MPSNGQNSHDTPYQAILGMWMPACDDRSGCDVCPANGLDDNLCQHMYDVMCSQSPKWWETQFEHLRTIERKPRKGKMPPKPKPLIAEEIKVQCKECGIQEMIELEDWHLVSRIKFLQDDLCGEVVHRCPGYGEVFVVGTHETVGQYIKRRKRGK